MHVNDHIIAKAYYAGTQNSNDKRQLPQNWVSQTGLMLAKGPATPSEAGDPINVHRAN